MLRHIDFVVRPETILLIINVHLLLKQCNFGQNFLHVRGPLPALALQTGGSSLRRRGNQLAMLLVR